ncbi:hypothetical protein BD779DRAFT_1551964 [Infundibulicybe gibba]|nr:hypothetical protein BD779DRAFT_1551964 [Infundibulicybe gibba]
MSERHVHFAADAYPPTPSPTYSYSSLPSPGGPFTPPSLGFSRSPRAYAPLPGIPIKLNPALGCSQSPLLNYNVSFPPSTITPNIPSLPAGVLAEPATHPPVGRLEIICPLLPWRITITPSGKPGSCVTVADVLTGIYTKLRLSVTDGEFHSLPTRDAQRIVNDTYRRRCSRNRDPRAIQLEESKGVKRVDFLAERTQFMGLSATPGGPDVWELSLS